MLATDTTGRGADIAAETPSDSRMVESETGKHTDHADDAMWTVAEMARFYRVSTAAIYKHADELGAERIGKVLRFPSPQAVTLNQSARGHHPTTERIRDPR